MVGAEASASSAACQSGGEPQSSGRPGRMPFPPPLAPRAAGYESSEPVVGLGDLIDRASVPADLTALERWCTDQGIEAVEELDDEVVEVAAVLVLLEEESPVLP